MAAKKKRGPKPNGSTTSPRRAAEPDGGGPRARVRRSDDDKVRLVRQVMQSGNQSAEIKKLGIYPNQFYDWKKKYAAQLGLAAAGGASRKRGQLLNAARSVADEAKAFIEGKAALLDRLREQRSELDELITQLEG